MVIDQSTNIVLLLKANSFNFGSFSFIESSNIFKSPLVTKNLAETATIETLIKVATIKAHIFLHFTAFFITLSNIKAYKDEYNIKKSSL